MKAANVPHAKNLLTKRDGLVKLSSSLTDDREFDHISGYIQFKGWRKELDSIIESDDLRELVMKKVSLLIEDVDKELKQLGVEL